MRAAIAGQSLDCCVLLVDIVPVANAGKTFRRVLKARLLRAALGAFGRPMPADTRGLVVIAPHPDDEVLACGGLLALAAKAGRAVAIVYLTSGESSHADCCDVGPSQVAREREQLAISAAGELGIGGASLHFLRLADGAIPTQGGEALGPADASVAAIIASVGPCEVYCPHPLDCREDHVNASLLTQAATRQCGADCTLRFYLTWGYFKLPLLAAVRLLRARPWSLDIGGVLGAKKAAMDRYCRQLAPCGQPYVGKLPPGFVEFFISGRECFLDRP